MYGDPLRARAGRNSAQTRQPTAGDEGRPDAPGGAAGEARSGGADGARRADIDRAAGGSDRARRAGDFDEPARQPTLRDADRWAIAVWRAAYAADVLHQHA